MGGPARPVDSVGRSGRYVGQDAATLPAFRPATSSVSIAANLPIAAAASPVARGAFLPVARAGAVERYQPTRR